MRFQGRYFDLTDRFGPVRRVARVGLSVPHTTAPCPARTPPCSAPPCAGDGPAEAITDAGSPSVTSRQAPNCERESLVTSRELHVGVAKRIVRTAVRRNLVRRIAREAWRAVPALSGPMVRTSEPQPWLLRLKSNPFDDPDAPRLPGRRVRQLGTGSRRIRQTLRADIDSVLQAALRGRKPARGSRGTRGPHGTHDPHRPITASNDPGDGNDCGARK